MRQLMARSYEKVMRIAGTLAVWDMTKDKLTPTVTVDHLRWAENYVDAANQTMYRFMNEFLFDERVHKDAKKILDSIDFYLTREGAQQANATQRVLIDRGYAPRSLVLKRSKLSAQRMSDALQHLTMAEMIESITLRVDGCKTESTGLRRL